jgi:CRISPR-associated protein Cas2
MYLIVTYDIAELKNQNRVLKTCRRYLNWVQKSVFEGELSIKQLEALKDELDDIISHEKDSVIFYEIRTPEVVNKNVIGLCKEDDNYFF